MIPTRPFNSARLFGIPIGIAALVFAGCSGSVDPSTATLRLHNDGTAQLFDVRVIFPDTSVLFGAVPVAATTDYQPAPGGVYAQAAFTFTYEGASVTQVVDDWVGKVPLKGQRFTYNVRLVTTAEGPGIAVVSIVKDR